MIEYQLTGRLIVRKARLALLIATTTALYACSGNFVDFGSAGTPHQPTPTKAVPEDSPMNSNDPAKTTRSKFLGLMV